MPNKTIKVVYDTSVLGFGQYDKGGRTGVFRLVENNVAGLAQSTQCELFFCASESMQMLVHAYDYLKRHGFLYKHSLLSYSRLARFYHFLESNRFPLSIRERLPLPLKMIRRLLSESVQSLNHVLKPLAPETLKGHQIYHSPYWALPEASRNVKGLQRFLTVHDLACILHPETSEAGGAFLESILKSATPRDWIVCVSQKTREDLLQYRPDLDPAKVLVIHSAAADRFQPVTKAATVEAVRKKYGTHAPYFLSVSTLEKRKNLPMLIEAFHHFTQLNSDVELVLAGPSATAEKAIREKMDSLRVKSSRVRFLGFVDDADLPALYSDCLAFVYPSFYEGFGFPALEAMQCGAPVITSTGGSLPEVVGDGGMLISPTDTPGFAEALYQMATSTKTRSDYQEKAVEQAKRFSWKQNTDALVSAYSQALG